MKGMSVCEVIIGILVVVVALWSGMGAMTQKWVLVVLGLILIVHSFACKSCCGRNGSDMSMKSSSGKKRR